MSPPLLFIVNLSLSQLLHHLQLSHLSHIFLTFFSNLFHFFLLLFYTLLFPPFFISLHPPQPKKNSSMATRATKSFGIGDRSKIWNRIPDLNTRKNFRTKYPSISPYYLTRDQLKEWSSFPEEVKNKIRAGAPLGEPPVHHSFNRLRMDHNVGAEDGVRSGIVTFVSEPINECFQKAHLGMRMGDFETGKSFKNGVKISGRKPDLVMWESEDRTIRVVGEIKTPWSLKDLQQQEMLDYLAVKLGIVIPSLI